MGLADDRKWSDGAGEGRQNEEARTVDENDSQKGFVEN